MDALTDTVATMTDAELAEQAAAIQTERSRRAVITDAAERTDTMCLDYLRATGRENGASFEAPAGVVGAYPRGWRVTLDGRAFEAAAAGTVTAPPGDSWTEVDPDSPIVDFWEPREYALGELARDAGKVWTATATVDGARPADYPGGWALAD